ncbi:hypothetical protein MPLA_320034 [Mesorhizobium sp. ORS 3359]|nr:hypothetical protein MPLA_320034 [Mesorhizobium sp. ORS 3359]
MLCQGDLQWFPFDEVLRPYTRLAPGELEIHGTGGYYG